VRSRVGRTVSMIDGAVVRFGDPTSALSLEAQGFRGERFETLVSCMASRTGAPADAWAIDYAAHAQALSVALRMGVQHMVLLSAICVQKPLLAFQRAKLAFEEELMRSGLAYSIVRPTAFFKSLSGQIARVQAGKPFLVFGDGQMTQCKPISDDDLGAYLARCVVDPALRDRVLPIGGPGPALSPRQQGEALFALLGRPARIQHIPVALLDGIILGLRLGGLVASALRAKAELARIGRYYATESMLVWDATTGRYDADATPSTGTQTLIDYYAQVLAGDVAVERGDHSVF
jgi:divinyl chlorophyllide a 8-vinyl-reductase